MNKQLFKKTMQMTGINGTFDATLEVLFNYKTETKPVENRIMHEQVITTFNYHTVRGVVGSDQFYSQDFLNEDNVWQYIDEVEKKINAKLHQLANVPKTLSIAEQLQTKGFKLT
jgi:hypothetical protein